MRIFKKTKNHCLRLRRPATNVYCHLTLSSFRFEEAQSFLSFQPDTQLCWRT